MSKREGAKRKCRQLGNSCPDEEGEKKKVEREQSRGWQKVRSENIRRDTRWREEELRGERGEGKFGRRKKISNSHPADDTTC